MSAANRQEFLLVLALKVDATRLEPTVKATLGAAVDPLVRYTDSEAHVYAKQVDDLVAADLDALAALIGWDAVQRLRVGDALKGGVGGPRVMGSDSARAVGRFDPDGPSGYRSATAPNAPLRATRAEAVEDERAWLDA